MFDLATAALLSVTTVMPSARRTRCAAAKNGHAASWDRKKPEPVYSLDLRPLGPNMGPVA